MSKRRNVRNRLELFTDLRDVLDAMKNFALVEIGRLTRTQRFRHHLLGELLRIAGLTAAFHPQRLAGASGDLYVAIGSERGFCGDFNEQVLLVCDRVRARDKSAAFIIVGSALAAKTSHLGATATLAGPITADEIESVLLELLQHIARWQQANPSASSISVMASDGSRVGVDSILPFEPPAGTRISARMPTLNVAPESFVRRFIDQYVDAKLHDAFATSLLAENHARLQHMTEAIARADDNILELQRRSRRVRQEEITQEVEMLLLAAGSAKGSSAPQPRRIPEGHQAIADSPR